MAKFKLDPIYPGKTFSQSFLLMENVPVYKAITGISQAAPVAVTCVGHGLPASWPIRVSGVLGMTEINTVAHGATGLKYLREKDSFGYIMAKFVDANTIKIPSISSERYTAWTSGGHIEYLTPMDLSGYTARAKAKNPSSGAVVLDMSTGNGQLILDTTARMLQINLSATATATVGALGLDEIEVDFELVSGSGLVPVAAFNKGPRTWAISREITT